jgi:hypothetical protein
MSKKYKVQHIGYPTTKNIDEEDWLDYSTHASERAAWRAISKYRSHLDHGSWDDHYRVVAPDGSVCSADRWGAQIAEENAERERKWYSRR